MRLEDCAWPDVERRLEGDRRIVIVLGATEEHAELSLATDTIIPYEIARAACAAENVLLAPPLPFGISTWSAAYPGTMSLRTRTMCAVVEDLIASLGRTGFRKFYFLNGHGLNRAVSPALGEATAPFEGAEVFFHQWWELEGVRDVARAVGHPFGHATWAEAFPQTMLSRPRQIQPREATAPNLLQPPEAIRAAMGMGHGPGPVQVDEDTMRRMFESAVASYRRVLAEEAQAWG